MPTLEALAGSGHEVVAVLTRPPARRGRGRRLFDSPVASAARERGIAVIESSRPGEEPARTQLAELAPDLGVVVAYGAILPQDVLDIPDQGWINLHFSDLPRWRGAAPVQRAIMAGDRQTATSVFQLEAGLDTGPVYSRIPVPLDGTETTGTLLEQLGQLGATQTLEVVDQIATGTATAVPQAAVGLTTAPQLTKAEGFVDFAAPSEQVDAQIRAFSPSPGAWTTLPGRQRLKLGLSRVADDSSTAFGAGSAGPGPASGADAVGALVATKKALLVRTSDGYVELLRVAPAGKGWMDGTAWARGARLADGTTLGAPDARQ